MEAKEIAQCITIARNEGFDELADQAEAELERLKNGFCNCEFSYPSIEATEYDRCGTCGKPYFRRVEIL